MAAIALLREAKCSLIFSNTGAPKDKNSDEIIKFNDVRMPTHMAQRQTTNTLCMGTERERDKDVLKISKSLILIF